MSVGKQLLGALGVIVAALCATGAALALAETNWEFAPVLFVWSYVALSMRAAYLTKERESVVEASPS
jgi:hypothetical protein